MEKDRKSNLVKIFLVTFLISALVIAIAYVLGGFEISLLFALVWLCSVIATIGVGIENTIICEIEVLHQNLKGYLLDMYAEMIKPSP